MLGWVKHSHFVATSMASPLSAFSGTIASAAENALGRLGSVFVPVFFQTSTLIVPSSPYRVLISATVRCGTSSPAMLVRDETYGYQCESLTCDKLTPMEWELLPYSIDTGVSSPCGGRDMLAAFVLLFFRLSASHVFAINVGSEAQIIHSLKLEASSDRTFDLVIGARNSLDVLYDLLSRILRLKEILICPLVLWYIVFFQCLATTSDLDCEFINDGHFDRFSDDVGEVLWHLQMPNECGNQSLCAGGTNNKSARKSDKKG